MGTWCSLGRSGKASWRKLLKGAGHAGWWELCARQWEQLEQRQGGDSVVCLGDSLQMVPLRWGRAGVRGRDAAGLSRTRGLTFIISTMVLRAIMAMMVYSKGGDTTNCHMRYWKLCLFWGMCRVRGLALMAKSMQALCGTQLSGVRARGGQRRTLSTLHPTRRRSPAHLFAFLPLQPQARVPGDPVNSSPTATAP